MTSPSRPLLPVLARMALGLGLVGLGGALVWQDISLRPLPGLAALSTPFVVPLDGKLPLDLATSATLRFASDRGNLRLSALPAGSPDLLSGEARHRAQNPLSVDVRRLGHEVNFSAWLRVPALGRDGVVVTGPPPLQHELTASLSRAAALTLNTETVGGGQILDLSFLRLRSVAARSDSGNLDLTLPALEGGPYAVVTRSGRVRVQAGAAARPEAVRVNSRTGDLDLNLAGASLDVLGAGSDSGRIGVVLPALVDRGSVTTISGDIAVTARPGTRGNLDIRTQSGTVTLGVPAGLRVRVRFPDRDTLLLPRGTPDGLAPALDLFVDAPAEHFVLKENGK
ncbi:DUF4097 family beta strand repeat-containing protein [Deinococcus sp. VB142]|uniref:DUF4097 family beta strand repeat-containing protein n=1 Tax=Deinococcus sp. VB142 TaxID=3112952 RepID=A0AAU6Q1F7_9DEIO